MNRRPGILEKIAAGAAIAAALTADLTEDQLVIVFLACVIGLGAIYLSEIFRLTKR
jgi:hypothetical protein